MSDVFVVATFGIGYVIAGLLVLGVTLGNGKAQMKLEPAKVRSRRR